MLKYLVTVTEDLWLVTVLLSLLAALCRLAYGRKGALVQAVGMGVGFLSSVIMALFKNLTSLVATNQWNFYLFAVTILVTAVFLLFSLIFGRRWQRLTVLGTAEQTALGFGGWALCVLAAMLSALVLFYELPDVLAYPFLFDTGGNGIFSADFGSRLAGWALALLMLFLYARFQYRCTVALGSRGAVLTVIDLALLINAVRLFGLAMSKWVVKSKWLRWLPIYSRDAYPWAFPFVRFVSNHGLLFQGMIAAVALAIPVMLLLRNLRAHGAFANPAERRKALFLARQKRRWSAAVVGCFACAVVVMTAANAYINRAVALSEPESYVLNADEISIDLGAVSDGQLHRFEYVTDNRVSVRWIIVQKPGGSYGVGLDACDVCGTAGYYQRGGDIVCKRCDVVMNINTIGFSGGCNPIPLEYRVEDGAIVIPLQAVLAAEKEFK